MSVAVPHRPRPNRRTAKRILETVLRVANVHMHALVSDQRHPDYTRARAVASYLIYHRAGMSYPETAEMIGYRSHSSAREAVLRARNAAVNGDDDMVALLGRVLKGLQREEKA